MLYFFLKVPETALEKILKDLEGLWKRSLDVLAKIFHKIVKFLSYLRSLYILSKMPRNGAMHRLYFEDISVPNEVFWDFLFLFHFL